jgi:predicted HTH transcriptional regulator
MDSQYETSPENAQKKLEYWKLTPGRRSTEDNNTTKRSRNQTEIIVNTKKDQVIENLLPQKRGLEAINEGILFFKTFIFQFGRKFSCFVTSTCV